MYSLHRCVLLQAVLDFHRQVAKTVSRVSEQCEELFGTSCEIPQDDSLEKMKIQLIGALNDSGRYFVFKEQMKVRPTAHIYDGLMKFTRTLKLFLGIDLMVLVIFFFYISVIISPQRLVYISGLQHAVVRIVRDKMRRTEPFMDDQQLKEFASKLYVYLVDEMHVAMSKVPNTHFHIQSVRTYFDFFVLSLLP